MRTSKGITSPDSPRPPARKRVVWLTGTVRFAPLVDLQVHVRVKGDLHNHPQLRIEPSLTGQPTLSIFTGRLAVLGSLGCNITREFDLHAFAIGVLLPVLEGAFQIHIEGAGVARLFQVYRPAIAQFHHRWGVESSPNEPNLRALFIE